MPNPLLDNIEGEALPDFAAIRPEHVMPALDTLLDGHDAALEAWLADPGDADLLALGRDWGNRLGRAWSPFSHLQSVRDDEALRPVYQQAVQRLTEHAARWQQDGRLHRAYQDLSETLPADPARARIVELELLEFRLAGVHLPDAQRERLRAILMRLSELGTRFGEQLQDATRAWSRNFTDPDALRGLPGPELDALAEVARARGEEGWTADLSEPAYHAVMTYADDRELRAEVYHAHATRASDQGPHAGRWDNGPLIDEMLALRAELAAILGYRNYAQYALARRMADTPEQVASFLERLAASARPAAQAQLHRLAEFAAERGAPMPLAPHDLGYWSEKYRQHALALSDEELKPFLPLPRMLDALSETVERLFACRLVVDAQVAAWHPDVQFAWLEDAEGVRFAGLYLDLYARPDKRGGAWMDSLRSRCVSAEGVQRPVAFLTCNFPPPAADRPSLLTHDDVQTLFHEFGHCLHHLLTEVDWPEINGTSGVEWDAVELPSQLLENWAWSRDLLEKHARHFESREPMPGELLDRLLASRQFLQALWLVRQLEYGLTDLRLHLHGTGDAPPDPVAVARAVHDEVAVVPMPDFNRYLCGFSHLFAGGYAAGYYSYLWAELLAADAWQRFADEGVFSRAAGADLRREILATGALRPALDSFVAFRGREPRIAPLLAHYGLEDATAEEAA